MGKYILRRLGATIVVLFFATLITFILIRLAPGNPALMMLADSATPEEIAAMEAYLGLDKPVIVQYLIYIAGIFKGDFGTSIMYQRPCIDIILSRLPATALLTFAGCTVGLLVAIPLGVLAGVKQGSMVDLSAMTFALLGQSMATVWLAVLLVLIFSVHLGWLPALGYGTFKHLILPAITIGFPLASQTTRLARSGMVDVLKEDYITSTYAKGISRRQVYTKYAFKNAMLPVITIVGLQIAGYLGGAVVTEPVFSWPGLGALMVSAIGNRDYPLVQSTLLVVAVMVSLVNLIVDIINCLVDRRMTLN